MKIRVIASILFVNFFVLVGSVKGVLKHKKPFVVPLVTGKLFPPLPVLVRKIDKKNKKVHSNAKRSSLSDSSSQDYHNQYNQDIQEMYEQLNFMIMLTTLTPYFLRNNDQG